MKKEPTSIRLKQIMLDKNLKQIDLLKKCEPICQKYNELYDLKLKISKSDLSQWLSGLYEPSARKLSVLADALNTNEVWLMGYDVSPEPKDTTIIHDDEKGGFLFFFKDDKLKNLDQYKEILKKDDFLNQTQKDKIYNIILKEYKSNNKVQKN